MTKRKGKPHVSRQGGVFFDSRKQKWVAEIAFPDGRKSYSSAYREDCERWLDSVRGYHSKAAASLDPDKIRREIEAMGDHDPQQVPGFPKSWLSAEGNLYGTATGRVIRRQRSKGIYYTLSQGHDSVSCTLERLRYCIEHDVDPLTMSHCRLSVSQGLNGTELMDVTEYIRQQRRAYHERKWYNVEDIIQENIEWNQHLLAYYQGDVERLTPLRAILERRRTAMENYITRSLKVSDEVRCRFIIDETISELMLRLAEKRCMVVSPLSYMEKLSRRINDSIRECHARVFDDGNVFHVKGDLTKVSRKKTAFNS